MTSSALSVREITARDIPLIIRYWLESPPDFLVGMGVALERMPAKQQWQDMLNEQLATPLLQKKSYCFIWLHNNEPVGHCNINKIAPDREAYMHLHMWNGNLRNKGMGAELVKMTLPHLFNAYNLQKLYSEPYALNPAPNKTLSKVGFELERTMKTIPGWINFEQEVNLWVMTRSRFRQLYSGL